MEKTMLTDRLSVICEVENDPKSALIQYDFYAVLQQSIGEEYEEIAKFEINSDSTISDPTAEKIYACIREAREKKNTAMRILLTKELKS